MWSAAWEVLETELAKVSDTDLQGKVSIRGVPFFVHEALCRALAHIGYHVGQIVVLARMLTESDWRWITIPKGKSEEYNQNPTKEKKMN